MRLSLTVFLFWALFQSAGCASSKPVATNLDAMRAQAEAEFAAWLSKPEVKEAISKKSLSGDYTYTVVIDYKGIVQTVYADDNADTANMARQNEMTRLLRTFTSTVRLGRNERVRFQPKIKV